MKYKDPDIALEDGKRVQGRDKPTANLYIENGMVRARIDFHHRLESWVQLDFDPMQLQAIELAEHIDIAKYEAESAGCEIAPGEIDVLIRNHFWTQLSKLVAVCLSCVPDEEQSDLLMELQDSASLYSTKFDEYLKSDTEAANDGE